MPTYEIFLTGKCSRNCSFCDVTKNSFMSSDADVKAFIDYVKQHESTTSFFSINFFGGEPLLCCQHIYDICDAFSGYPHCKFVMTTNGDFIEMLDKDRLPAAFSLSISAYDIFIDSQKYVKMMEMLQPMNVKFRFTFDESTLCRIDDFKKICASSKIPYKVVFSHSKKSWINISASFLEEKLRKFYSDELHSFYESSDFAPPLSMLQPFTRFVQRLFDPHAEDMFCVTERKAVFYGGSNIGSCIRLKNASKFNYPRRCQLCKYAVCCSKGCVAEYCSNDIDEKLCMINKVAFEEIERFVDMHLDEERLSQILCYTVNNMHHFSMIPASFF